MALFQRRPDFGSSIRISTYGMNKTRLFVGLGNPGPEYNGTRHNIGFDALDAFAEKNDFEPWVNKTDFKAHIASKTFEQYRIILCKPQTFMNLSGEAVQAVNHFYKITSQDIFVVHDELDLDFGQIRTRFGGGSAGHKGIKSVNQHIGEEYGRIKIGIGPKNPSQIDSADFVLQRFDTTQREEMPKLIREMLAILSEYAYGAPSTSDTRTFL